MKLFSNPSVSVLLLLLTSSVSTHAFTNGIQDLMQRAFQPKQDLHIFSEFFPGTVLDVRLDISDGTDTNKRMTIQNLVLELHNHKDDKTGSHLPMPGFNGPHPSTSGGVGRVDVLKAGHFIDLTGRVTAKFAPLASWELIWRNEAPAGALICGLELLDDAVRNSAKLPKGRIYISFPVWSPEKLAEYQVYRADCEAKSKVHLQERDDQLLKMQETNNLLAKALHYRNAFAAVEQYSLQPRLFMSKVPSDTEVIKIADELLLTQTGTVWTKGTGNPFLGGAKQTLLGSASISKPPPTTTDPSSSSSNQAATRLSERLAP
jgi:hypothetical protein